MKPQEQRSIQPCLPKKMYIMFFFFGPYNLGLLLILAIYHGCFFIKTIAFSQKFLMLTCRFLIPKIFNNKSKLAERNAMSCLIQESFKFFYDPTCMHKE